MVRLKTLVVDDELGIRLGVTRVLQTHTIHHRELDEDVSFELDTAATGEEALGKIAQAQPDILLLDHKLPGIQGLEVLERVTSEYKDVLTVMITAYATIETAVQATRRGAHDFLAKPFTPDELKSTIYKAAKHIMLQREARRLAAEKRQVRFQFISVLAHELKTPLAAVEGYLEVLKDGAAEPGTQAYADVLNRSLLRLSGMRKMIADILDLTRIESGQKQRELSLQDVRAAAGRAMEAVQAAAVARGVTMVLDAPEPVEMVADPGELDIIFNNLVSNAVKYNRDGGRVDVTVARHADVVTITVRDTGIGLTPDEAAQLFAEFVRIKNAKTRGILGSGLGLSIVKKLALLYDGDVQLESAPDVGSTFTVTLKAEGKAES
jgi:two-component system, sensor histidine kinase and response regulator